MLITCSTEVNLEKYWYTSTSHLEQAASHEEQQGVRRKQGSYQIKPELFL